MPGQDGTIHVLHVDDDPAIVELSATFLEREDGAITALTETEPRAALHRLSTVTVDCVVSDYQMPAMDGLEFFREVRSRFPVLPFIMFTGKGDDALREDAITAGVTDYLEKSTGVKQYSVLADRIRAAVGSA